MPGTQDNSMSMARSVIKVVLPVVVFMSSLLVTMCAKPYGSVGKASIEEVMQADAIAVTPCIPGWLLEPHQIHRLSNVEFRELRAILRRGELKQVHESQYYTEEHQHEGATEPIFYLYASNAQCLGAKVVGQLVVMDDFDLTEEDSRALYRLLRRHLEQVLGEL